MFDKQKVVLLLVIFILGFVSGGCGGQEAQPKTVLVGAIYPLSGADGSIGEAAKQAIELAAEIVNQEYDLDLPLARSAGLPRLGGARIKVVFADSGGDPDRAAVEAQRLIDEGVVALIGSYHSKVTASASQVAEAAGIPFVNPESASPTLTRRGYKWFFRVGPDSIIFVRALFDFLADVQESHGLPTRDIAMVYENSLWGTGTSQEGKRQATQLGYNVVADIPYASDTNNVETEVQILLETGHPIVMQTSYTQDALLYLQTYDEMGFQPTALLALGAGFYAPDFLQAAGANKENILCREVWALDLREKNPLIRQVDDLYFERYGHHFGGVSARAFTSVLVLADAIDRAASTDPQAIREALLDTDIPVEQLIMPWDGVRFDPDTGQNTLAKGIVVQMQDDVYRTVWPWELASAPLVWPIPAE